MEILRSAHKYWLMPAFRWNGLGPGILILLHTSLGKGIENYEQIQKLPIREDTLSNYNPN